MRDAAIRRLSESVAVSSVEQNDGSVNLFLANGQPLVVGGTANEMALVPDALDPQSARVGIRAGSGVLPLEPSTVGGGRIGGLLQFRELDLPGIENQLGRLAASLTGIFNAQHRLGDDRNGVPGGDLFSADRRHRVCRFQQRQSGHQHQRADHRSGAACRLRLPRRLRRGQYRLTRLVDGANWTQASATFTQDGLTIALANTPPADGDRFLVQPLRNASRNVAVTINDIGRIAAAAPVRGFGTGDQYRRRARRRHFRAGAAHGRGDAEACRRR